ncbi:IS630 family transposase [Devosia naphthalenivorans]|uniref:IS630 family transposase n=1 Tax=Devosia naphthalenivorans TaxID=2082392 RepID=UPI001FE8F1BC|nr:IS630 family transposase [Devosia naphthalenivorans]
MANWIDRLRGDRLELPLRGDPDTVARLLRSVHDPRSRQRNRAVTVLAHEQGFPIKQISAYLGLSRNTSRRYLRTYREAGVERLMAPMTRGPLKAESEVLKTAVFRLLHEPPKDHGVNRTSWIMRDLRATLERQGFPACLHVLRQIIQEAGWKWRKARTVLTSQDPAYREKLAAVQTILSNLASDEAFFSIDEFGPFAVRMKQGLMLDPPGPHRVVPQWQKSKGCMIMTAALELSGNQVTHFYSDKKNTTEMIRMMDVLLERYADRRTLYLSWDAASWHVSKKLKQRITEHNLTIEASGLPRVETAPLPSGAQFLNVIESVFSGMSRAVIHNSNYQSVDAARAAIDLYFAARNQQFRDNPKRAGNRIWGDERVPPAFLDSNNCKDPTWR